MLPFDLVVSVLVGLAAFQGVACRPSHYYSINLQTCETTGSSNRTAVDLCLPVCRPLLEALRACNGNPECSCSTAPPQEVQSCLECHLETATLDEDGSAQLDALVNSRLTAYSLLCEGITGLPNLLSPRSAVNTISRREGGDFEPSDACVFGLPKVVFPEASQGRMFPLPSLGLVRWFSNPFLILGFVVLAVAGIVTERRVRKSAVKS